MKLGRVVALDTTANLMAAHPGTSLEEVFCGRCSHDRLPDPA